MNQPIHPLVRAEFLSLDAYYLLKQWLLAAANVSQMMQQLFTEEEMSRWFPKSKGVGLLKGIIGKDDLVKESILGVTLREKTVSMLYVKINRIQDLMRKNPNATHLDILRVAEPYLSKYYGGLLQDFPTIDVRFNNGFSLLYGDKREKSGAHQTKKTAFASLHTMHGKPLDAEEYKTAREFSVAQAQKELDQIHSVQQNWRGILAQLEQSIARGAFELSNLTDINIIETIINALDFKNLKPDFSALLLQTLIDMKVQFNVLKLKNCSIDDIQMEQLLANAHNLQILHMENCGNITGNVVAIIARHCPIIESLSIVNSNLKIVDNQRAVLIALFTPLNSKPPICFGELRFLDVSNNSSLVELHLNAKRLAKLHLMNCRQLRVVKLNSDSIDELDISGCAALTNEKLSDFVTDATNLSSIKANNCPLIRCSSFYMKFPYLLPVDVSVYTDAFLQDFVNVLRNIMPSKLNQQIATSVLKVVEDFKRGGDVLKKLLLRQLQKESTDIIYASILAFRKLGRKDDDIISELQKLLGHHMPWIQQAAAISLFELAIKNQQVISIIENGLNSNDEKILFNTLIALAHSSEFATYSQVINSKLIKIFTDTNATQGKINYALLVCQHLQQADEVLFSHVQNLLKTQYFDLVPAVVYTLACLANKSGQPIVFRKALHDAGMKDVVVFRRTLLLAKKIDIDLYEFLATEFKKYFSVTTEVDQSIVTKLKHADWNVQLEALKYINDNRIFTETLVTCAIDLFYNIRTNLRELAISYIINVCFSDQIIQDKLLEVLNKASDWHVRFKVIQGLCVTIDKSNPKIPKALCKCLLDKDENTNVRAAAAESLGFQSVFSKDIIASLAQGADDSYTDVVLAVIESLTTLISFNTLKINLTQLDFSAVSAYAKGKKLAAWTFVKDRGQSQKTETSTEDSSQSTLPPQTMKGAFFGSRTLARSTTDGAVTIRTPMFAPTTPPTSQPLIRRALPSFPIGSEIRRASTPEATSSASTREVKK